MAFSFRERKQNLDRLAGEHFDLVIVGGGITGAGVARDAASRGMKVALIEAQDFAEGTSSRSSKLIHGGVRYLENFEFGLVFEALAERALLFKMAPHLVHPLRFLIPIYKSSRVGFWKMLAGMWLYDLLALFETPQMHESLNSAETQERVPSLNGRELSGAMEYSDAYTDDDRLVIETLRDAHRMGACIVNKARVAEVKKEKGRVKSLIVEDSLLGKNIEVIGDQYVSSVGPWTDIFGSLVDPAWKNKLRPTKGAHLVFSRKRIPIEKAVVMAVEKRIIFVIPRLEMVIVGTTDTDFNRDPGGVNTDIADVQYILHALNEYFPALQIEESDILSSYAGVRPLIDDGSSSEGKTSREHSIWSEADNLTFVAGGKYTTYRKMSEDTVDFVLKKMPFAEAMVFSPSDTKKALNPQITESLYNRALAQTSEMSKFYKVPESIVTRLVLRHGEESRSILKLIKSNYLQYSVNEAYWMGEAHFAIHETMCLSLRDFYWRRVPLFLGAKDHGIKYLSAISRVFKEEMGWDDIETNRQQNELMHQLKKDLAWKVERSPSELS